MIPIETFLTVADELETFLKEKPARHDYPLHGLIRNRWSPRVFDERPVESWKICTLLEAARWAPSSYNEQPWRFFVGSRSTSPDALTILQSLLVPQNQAWANKAPVLTLSVAKRTFSHNGEPNRHAFHDVGLAMANLTLQALDLGLVTHQMAGFYPNKAIERLGIPPDYEPVAMCAIGYPGTLSQLAENHRDAEQAQRFRHPLQDLCFSTYWEQPYTACFN